MGKNKPTHEIRLGSIRATIWKNETKDGGPWFAVTLSRVYESNGNWKDVASFRRDDLPIVAKALDMAYDWMWRAKLQAQLAEKATSEIESSCEAVVS